MENKQKHFAATLLVVLLTLAGLALTVYALIAGKETYGYRDLPAAIGYAVILFYALFGYKTPHGNLLRYCFMIYALLYGVSGALAPEQSAVIEILEVCVVTASAYVAGRLGKFKSVIIVMVAAAGLLLGELFATLPTAAEGGFLAAFLPINFLILWVSLCLVYRVRYQDHRDAGLADNK